MYDGAFYPATWASFAIPGIFLNIATFIWIVEAAQRALLQSDYDVFEDFCNDKQKYDNHKAGIWFGKFGWALLIISLPFVFGQRLILAKNTMTVKAIHYLQEKSYSFSDISGIVRYKNMKAPNGDIVPNDHYQIFFSDGNHFNPAFYFDGSKQAMPFVSELSNKTKIPVEIKDTEF